MKNLTLTFVFVALCFYSHAQTVPATLSYQGILLQNDGITPLADGPHTIIFNFYDVGTGGTALFSRTVNVNTVKGLYTCILGDGSSGNAPLPASLGNQQMFIGIRVNGGSELTPRAQLTTTPYAWMAQSAYTIADNTVSTTKIVDGAVTNTKLAAGIDAAKLSGSATLPNTVLDIDLQDLADGVLSGSGKVANSATSALSTNTANAIVTRDASGNFSAGTITANVVGNVTGNVTGNISGNAATVTTNANLTGDVTSVGNVTAIAPGAVTNTKLAAASSSNTNNTVVLRDATGNFAAGTITANLIGNVSGNGSGLTNLNADNISSGTINAARLPASTLTGTGTVGNIAFWNGATSFGNDAGLFWQNTAPQSLGIGTVSPSSRLHISGDGSVRRGIQLSQTTAGTGWTINNFETGASEGAGNFGINQIGVGNRLLINTTGNVGIGGSPNANALLSLQNATSPALHLRRDGSNEWFFTATPIGTDRLGFRYGGNADANERFTILGSGNVGIGTINPSSTRLSVVAGGTTQLSGTVLSPALVTSAGSLGSAVGSEVNLASFGALSSNASSLGVRLRRIAAGTSWSSTSIGIGMDVDNTVRAGGSAIWIGNNGGIGIGTDNPQTTFHVSGRTRIEATDEAFQLVGSTHSYMGFYPDGFGTRKGYFGYPDANVDDLTLANQIAGADIILSTNGGNVGIGTSSPSSAYTLDILGDGIRVRNDASPSIHLQDDGALGSYQDYGLVNDGGVYKVQYVNWVSGLPVVNDRFTIQSDGDIGINTTSPDQKLTVNGNASKTGGGPWATFSDLRMKKDVVAFKEGLEATLQFRPVKFKYNGLGGYPNDQKEYVGVIAQEVNRIAPYMVSVVKKRLSKSDTADTDLLMYDASALPYILINAIQEQQSQIEDLKSANKELEDRLTAIEALLNKSNSTAISASKTEKQ